MKRILFIVLIVWGSNWLYSQKVKFSSIHNDEFLHNGDIQCVHQDKRGFLWVGTSNGLFRYSGSSSRIYKYDFRDTSSLTDNQITALCEDAYGNLWIGTHKGLCRYSLGEDKMFRYPLTDTAVYAEYESVNHVFTIYPDPYGNLWVIIPGDILVYNRELDIFQNYSQHIIYKQQADSSNELTSKMSFLMGPKAILRDGSDLYFSTWNQGLVIFDTEKLKILGRINNENLLSANKINFSLLDDKGRLWIASWDNGIYVVDPEQGKLILHIGPPLCNRVVHFMQAENGYIWVSTDGFGLWEFHPESLSYQIYKSGELYSFNLPSNNIRQCYEDKDGIIWVSTDNGLVYLSPYKRHFEEYPIQDVGFDVTAMVPFKDTAVIITTWGKGNFIFYPKQGRYERLSEQNSKDLFYSKVIQDKDGNYWFASRNFDLLKYDSDLNFLFTIQLPIPDEEIINRLVCFDTLIIASSQYNDAWFVSYNGKHYKRFPAFLKEVDFSNVFKDRIGNFWLISRTLGIKVVHPEKGVQMIFTHINTRNSIPVLKGDFRNINHIFEYDGNVWISTKKEVFVFDLKKKAIVKSIPLTCYSSFVDKKNQLWLGCIDGLFRYDAKNGSFDNLTLHGGLQEEEVFAMHEVNGNLWMHTSYGITVMNLQNLTLLKFTTSDGLLKTSFQKDLFVALSKIGICVGSKNGVNVLPMATAEMKRYNRLPLITDIFVNGESYPMYGLNNKATGSEETDYNAARQEIVIKHPYKNIGFYLAFPDYRDVDNYRFEYQLVGFDDKLVKSRNGVVTYSNLSPGKYIFRFRASNNINLWSDYQKITLVLKPPFFKTWWFFGGTALIIFLLVYLVIGLRTRNIARNNERLRLQVLQRTNEIFEKTEELKVQKEKIELQKDELIRLNETKDKIFSILAHDLRNPFQSIAGFSALLFDKYDQYPDDKRREFIRIIDSSVKNTYQLLENILQWSKTNLNSIQLSPEYFDVSKLVKDNIEFYKSFVENKNISIHFQQGEQFIFADREMINTIVRNLLANAIKFTPREGNVSIDYHMNKQGVKLIVSDTGIGISEKNIQKLLFGEGFTSNGTSGEKGTGLGLFICKEFVERHHGKIEIESKEGMGTTIQIWIPQ